MRVKLTVNGEERALELEPRTLLVHALRDSLGLTGTHAGCDTSQCGACTVLLDGRAVKSCTMLALQAEDAEVTTIEGFARTFSPTTPPNNIPATHPRTGSPPGSPTDLHPLQAAFRDHHGLQCGFCTPGMILTAADLLASNPDPTDGAIRHALDGNLCRCTGYQPVVESIRAAAEALR